MTDPRWSFVCRSASESDDLTQMLPALELAEHEVRHIGAADEKPAAWKAAVRDAVAPGSRAVRQPRRPRDGPVQSAGHDDTLHLDRALRDVSQERAAHQPT